MILTTSATAGRITITGRAASSALAVRKRRLSIMRTRSDGGCLHTNHSRSIVTRPFSQEQQLIEHVIINHSVTRIVLYEGGSVPGGD